MKITISFKQLGVGSNLVFKGAHEKSQNWCSNNVAPSAAFTGEHKACVTNNFLIWLKEGDIFCKFQF